MSRRGWILLLPFAVVCLSPGSVRASNEAAPAEPSAHWGPGPVCPTPRCAPAFLVKDIIFGSRSGDPGALVDLGGTLLFGAESRAHGRELWRSDGTAAGTVLVKDIRPGPEDSLPELDDETGLAFEPMVLGDGVVFFTADDGVHGRELWKSDGTAAGTVLVKDVFPGEASSSPTGLMFVDGVLFFTADDGVHGRELWRSDGTEAGTFLVADIFPGLESSIPSSLVAAGGVLFFEAEEGVHGGELWKSDGTEAGTVLVKDILPGPDSAFPFHLAVVGDTLFFSADDEVHGRELWKSDGTEAGTVLVKDVLPGPDWSNLDGTLAVGGRLFFFASTPEHGDEPWVSDGTEAGTHLIKDVNPGPEDSFPDDDLPRFRVALGDVLMFDAEDGVHGVELWRTDGTEAGTVLVKDIFPGPEGGFPTWLAVADGTLLFSASDARSFDELWRSDGTEAGTYRIRTVTGGPRFSGPRAFTVSGGHVFFRAFERSTGAELWALPRASIGECRPGTAAPDGRRGEARGEAGGGTLAEASRSGSHLLGLGGLLLGLPALALGLARRRKSHGPGQGLPVGAAGLPVARPSFPADGLFSRRGRGARGGARKHGAAGAGRRSLEEELLGGLPAQGHPSLC